MTLKQILEKFPNDIYLNIFEGDTKLFSGRAIQLSDMLDNRIIEKLDVGGFLLCIFLEPE